jgi:hypothetical protein
MDNTAFEGCSSSFEHRSTSMNEAASKARLYDYKLDRRDSASQVFKVWGHLVALTLPENRPPLTRWEFLRTARAAIAQLRKPQLQIRPERLYWLKLQQ